MATKVGLVRMLHVIYRLEMFHIFLFIGCFKIVAQSRLSTVISPSRLKKRNFFVRLVSTETLPRMYQGLCSALKYFSFSLFQVSHSPECQDVLRFLGNWCGAPQNPSYSFS